VGSRGSQLQTRCLIKNDLGLWQFCTIVFSPSDNSIYLLPFGSSRRYFYGRRQVSEGVMDFSINYQSQEYTEEIPKISLHGSGQVHIKSTRGEANIVGPLFIPELATLNDCCVATLAICNVNNLKEVSEASSEDLVIGMTRPVLSATFAFRLKQSATPFERKFLHRLGLPSRVARARLADNLYLGVEMVADYPPPSSGSHSTMLIVGFDPRKTPAAKQDCLYICCE
jgi:hypothetical protein